jgi:hypothetical protein
LVSTCNLLTVLKVVSAVMLGAFIFPRTEFRP